jgi:hypothetical protein
MENNNNNETPVNPSQSLYDVSNTYNECLSIINDKKILNHNDLALKWEEFKKKFPQLYEMLTINDNIDLRLLKFLCDSAEKQNKLTNSEERLENDFNVGDQLGKTFVYDKFPEPSNKQKEYIKETLRTKIKNGETFSAKK